MSEMFVSNYKIYNKSIPSANTEVSQALSEGASYFEIKARNPAHELKLAFVDGESGTNYFTISQGGNWYTKGKIVGSVTLYVQSPSAGAVAEIIEAR